MTTTEAAKDQPRSTTCCRSRWSISSRMSWAWRFRVFPPQVLEEYPCPRGSMVIIRNSSDSARAFFSKKFGGAEETGHHQDGKALADVLEIDVGAVGGGEKVAFCDCHVCDPFLGRITVLLLYKNRVINQIYRFYEKYNKKVIEG